MRIELTHSFDVGVAEQVGVNKALLAKEIIGWELMNERNGRNFHQGHYWTYNTAEAYAKKFPYMTRRSIGRWLNEMERDGQIYSGKFGPKVTDHTKSYRVNREWYAKAANSPIGQNDHSIGQNGQPFGQNVQNTYTSIYYSSLTGGQRAREEFLSEEEIDDLDARTADDAPNPTPPVPAAPPAPEPDDPVSPETAARRNAVIAKLRDRTGSVPATPDEPEQRAGVDPITATENLMAEAQTPEGQRKLRHVYAQAGIPPGEEINLYAAVAACAARVAAQSGNGTVNRDLWGKLPGYVRTELKIKTRQKSKNNEQAKTSAKLRPGQDPISDADVAEVARKWAERRKAKAGPNWGLSGLG